MTRIPNLHPGLKLLISILVGGLAYSSSFEVPMEPFTRLMIGWDFLGITYISISVITLFNTQSKRIRAIAQKQDRGHQILFILLLLASFSCMLLIALLIKTNRIWVLNKDLLTLIYLSGVIVCWLMLHIIFTFRYAHMFYGNDKDNKSTHRGGLGFPGNLEPDYLDFAYFSFVIGMTFQVSDVTILDRVIRRTVLFHALIAFVFNTVIIALSVNAIMNASI
jgi:uncharacterized membrane protein